MASPSTGLATPSPEVVAQHGLDTFVLVQRLCRVVAGVHRQFGGHLFRLLFRLGRRQGRHGPKTTSGRSEEHVAAHRLEAEPRQRSQALRGHLWAWLVAGMAPNGEVLGRRVADQPEASHRLGPSYWHLAGRKRPSDTSRQKEKPIHLTRFPHLASQRLAFFFQSLKWIENVRPGQGMEFKSSTDALTSEYFDPGSIPSLTQSIPAYNEVVLVAESLVYQEMGTAAAFVEVMESS